MHGKLYKVLEITLLDKPTEYWSKSNYEIVQIFYCFIMK